MFLGVLSNTTDELAALLGSPANLGSEGLAGGAALRAWMRGSLCFAAPPRGSLEGAFLQKEIERLQPVYLEQHCCNES